MLAKFEIYHDGEYWCARGLGADVFTQGKTYEELLRNIEEAALLHFEDEMRQGEPLHILLLSEMEVKSAA